MAAVIHKLALDGRSNPEYKKQLEYAKIINHRLSNPKHPELNSKIKPDLIAKLNADVKNMEMEEMERERGEEIRSRFNVVPGILTFIVSTLIFITAGYYLRSALPIFFGVPFSIALGFMAAIYFREKTTEEIKEDVKNSGKFPGVTDWGKPSSFGGNASASNDESDAQSQQKEEKLSSIYKAADNFVFPKKFNKITDKVLDPKSLRKRIYENLDNIKRNNLTLASGVTLNMGQNASLNVTGNLTGGGSINGGCSGSIQLMGSGQQQVVDVPVSLNQLTINNAVVLD